MAANDDHEEPSDVGHAEPPESPAPRSEGTSGEPAGVKSCEGTKDSDHDRTWYASGTASQQIKLPVNLDPPRIKGSIGRMENYEILNLVGRGGMGVVARAFDQQLHRNVAIKVMSERLITSERARRRFLREARAAASVNHPNVVTIHAVSERDGIPFLVMEYVDGQALQTRIENDAPMCYEDVLRIGAQIASGLAAAHRHGIIHRDIKPGNVMLEDRIERVKLTDFGLARLLVEDSELTSLGDMVGTPAYMSPEQVSGDDLTAASDLFSLGSVLYAMFLGKSPFHTSNTFASATRVKEFEPPPISSFAKDVPREFDQLISRLLSKSPQARPKSAEEVADLLVQWSAEKHQRRLPSSRINQPSLTESADPSVRRRVGMGWGALVLAAVAVTGWWFADLTRTSLPISPEDALADGILRVHAEEGEFPTLHAALAAAQPGTTIQLLPGLYSGPFEVSDGERFDRLKILGEAGVTLMAPADTPVIRVSDVAACEIRDLTIVAESLQHGLSISGLCPGLLICDTRFIAKQPDRTRVETVRLDFGASGARQDPIEITDCIFDGGAVGLVIGSHDPSEDPVKHVHVHHNRLQAASTSYGIPLVVQGRVTDVLVERNLMLRGLGGISINLPVTGGAEDLVIRYNTLADIDTAFFFNDSLLEQDVLIEKNLVVGARTLHTITGSPAQYKNWFSENQWLSTAAFDPSLVESMFTVIPTSALQSLDPHSSEYLKPSDSGQEKIAGFYAVAD